jgi:uncharacterized protein (DUF1330 family)
MAKGIWIAHVDVKDPERYKLYVEGAAPAFAEYDAKFIARGGKNETVDGEAIGERHVVIEFKDMETARACFFSEAYQAAREHRIAASSGRVILVEGIE